jgi:hypothetical protein
MGLRQQFMMTGVLLAVTGCAVTPHRGSVAMKLNAREAHACIGKGEVVAGDRVVLYRNECTGAVLSQAKPPAGGSCRRVKLGEGRVVRPLNEHYSVIEVDPGIDFDEGAIVEKL